MPIITDPYFETKIIPVSHIAIPGHEGGFKHMNSAYRLVIDNTNKTILGLRDKATGFQSNTALQTLLYTGAGRINNTNIDDLSVIHYNGREADLIFKFNDLNFTIDAFTFTYVLRMRNSYDLSINKHVLSEVLVTHSTMDLNFLMPTMPYREAKIGRYGNLYQSEVNRLLTNATSDMTNTKIRLQAMQTLNVTNQNISEMTEATNGSTYSVRRAAATIFGGEPLYAYLLATFRYADSGYPTAKSSKTSLYFRKMKKLTDYIQETFNEDINQAVDTIRERGDRDAITGDDAPLERTTTPDDIHATATG